MICAGVIPLEYHGDATMAIPFERESFGMHSPMRTYTREDAQRLERLTLAMAAKGIPNGSALAKVADLVQVTARSYLNKTRPLSAGACIKISKALDISFDWLYSGIGAMSVAKGQENVLAKAIPLRVASVSNQTQFGQAGLETRIPVYGTAAGSRLGAIAMGQVVAELDPPVGMRSVGGVYAVYVVGESMMPRYDPGEVVFARRGLPLMRGKYVVVQIEEDDGVVLGFIKRFVSQTDDELVLESLNPPETLRLPMRHVQAVDRIINSGEG